ncbi:MAG TPA: carbohydrate kinase family protein [Candidatus Pacearchaeota archaeon]|nr:carbohydrate kinase family protein [Candidatus Pacearchaeota archaeon]
MYDVITFGSGTKDTYLILDQKKIKDGNLDLCFRYGAKVEAHELRITTGGGGTNSAAALSKLGYRTAWCGMVGDDNEGKDVITDLKKFGVDGSFIKKTKEKPTNQSIVLMSPGSDRTILIYRGASNEYGLQDLDLKKIKAKWIYIAPLAGKNLDFFAPLLEYAADNGIKVMVNPGIAQIDFLKQNMHLLSKIDILSVNEDEAARLTGYNSNQATESLNIIAQAVKSVAVITKGENGVEVADKKNLFSAGVIDVKIVDKTGAGDSFNAGFLAEYMKTGNIPNAIQLATADATCNMQNWGAKFNLLCPNDNWERVNVTITSL